MGSFRRLRGDCPRKCQFRGIALLSREVIHWGALVRRKWRFELVGKSEGLVDATHVPTVDATRNERAWDYQSQAECLIKKADVSTAIAVLFNRTGSVVVVRYSDDK